MKPEDGRDVVTPDDWSTPHNPDWLRFPWESRDEWAAKFDPEVDGLFGGLSEYRREDVGNSADET